MAWFRQLIRFDALFQRLPRLQCPFDQRKLVISQDDCHITFRPLCIENMVHWVNRYDVPIQVWQFRLQFLEFVHLALYRGTIHFREVVAPELDTWYETGCFLSCGIAAVKRHYLVIN